MKKILVYLYIAWLYLINILTKIPLGLILWLRHNVRYRNLSVLYRTKPPYVMLPNHTNQWDPFILSWVTPHPIRWVASDAALRDAFRKMLLAVGVIPKVKEQSDMITLQELKKAKKQKLIAGIFPEGTQNWDGITGDLIPATAKLVRFLKIPVVVPLIKGGYLSKPRWTWKARRTRIVVHFTRIIDADELGKLKLGEIEKRITDALSYNEYEWQRKTMAPIHSSKRAEHIELAHWACPSCLRIGEMRSNANTLYCSNCRYTVEVDRYGFLVYPEEGPSFRSPHEWLVWQNDLMMDRLRSLLDAADLVAPDGVSAAGEGTADSGAIAEATESGAAVGEGALAEGLVVEAAAGTPFAGTGEHPAADPSDPILLQDADVTLMKGLRAMPMLPVHRGEARLYRDRIEVGDPGGEILSFPFREATAGNTFKQQKFEFRYQKAQYRFRFPGRHVSGHKWEIAYKGLREILIERGEW